MMTGYVHYTVVTWEDWNIILFCFHFLPMAYSFSIQCFISPLTRYVPSASYQTICILKTHFITYLRSRQEPPVRTLCIPISDDDCPEDNVDDVHVPSGSCLGLCVSPAAKTLLMVMSHAWLVRGTQIIVQTCICFTFHTVICRR